MKRRRLGKSGLIVSTVGLGTMNFGSQVEEADAIAILDHAIDAGINFIDTAEMYASPPTPASFGRSEKIIGAWLRQTQKRDSIVLATKLVGPADGLYASGAHVRGGLSVIDAHHLVRSLEGSLRRLNTDYVDLFQFHWPERTIPLEEQLEACHRLVTAGKVRYIGTSNETPWGLTRLAATCEKLSLPHPASVQNRLNLLQRNFERGLAEACREEEVGFIAFSPLAMGLLTGKYSDGALPRGSRFQEYDRYRQAHNHPLLMIAAGRYVKLAQEVGLAPSVMSLAWVCMQPDVACVLSSCSRIGQVETLIAGATQSLDADLLARLDAIRDEFEPSWMRE